VNQHFIELHPSSTRNCFDCTSLVKYSCLSIVKSRLFTFIANIQAILYGYRFLAPNLDLLVISQSSMGFFTWIIGGSLINNLQLDIVGFLAVLGEGAVLSNSQVAALHRITYLPRLLPAPQALLRPSRPEKLASHVGVVASVHSGNIRTHINHIGHILAQVINIR
jgi:hypothetical protein